MAQKEIIFTRIYHFLILELTYLRGGGYFWALILIGGQLTAGGVLSALATFRILQEPLRNFPDLVSVMA
ncbi:putative ABC-type xenobiotic transporter [Helianthus annuus]|nr:putative ABC-type xenobiotic transporter [Helianthus annuus]KAJ0718437.1 putative ABC-type xenobiotic transporter [Helianthus annuus]